MTDNKTGPTSTPEQFQAGNNIPNTPGSEPSFGSFQPAPAVAAPNPMDSMTNDLSNVSFATPGKPKVGDDDYDDDDFDEDRLGSFGSPDTPKELKELAKQAAATPAAKKLYSEVNRLKSNPNDQGELVQKLQAEIVRLRGEVEHFKEQAKTAHKDGRLEAAEKFNKTVAGIQGAVDRLTAVSNSTNTNVIEILKVAKENKIYLSDHIKMLVINTETLTAKNSKLFADAMEETKKYEDLLVQTIEDLKKQKAAEEAEKQKAAEEAEKKKAAEEAEKKKKAAPTTSEYNLFDKIEFIDGKGHNTKTIQGTIAGKANKKLYIIVHPSGKEMSKLVTENFKPKKIQEFDDA